AGHIPTRVGTRHAVTSGLASLEHLYDILISTSTEEDAIRAEILDEISGPASQDINPQSAEKNRTNRLLATYSPKKADALFKLIREHGTWLTPTLLVNADPRCPGSPLPPIDDAFLSDLPGYLQRFVQLPDATREDIELDCRRFEKLSALVGEMEKAELPLLAGSDGPNPGVKPGMGLHDELMLLVRAGLSPARALQIATRDAARFMGQGDALGTIEVGKVADLVLLDANPLDDIRNTRRITHVIVNGVPVEQ
ncbi:MAG: amidohydrolase family protein, partial [Gammaproteobacteria bacterium]|nr:amidohydrolase family protein [Gammaproteobacteria bacterium]